MAVKGHVDGMVGAYVIGWAAATPDTGNCAISITDAQGEVLAKGRASRHRADLASVGIGRTTLAFRIPVKNLAERRFLHVLADGVELTGSPIITGTEQYDGECHVEGDTVTGWVTERVEDFLPPVITVVDQHGVIAGEAISTKDLVELDTKFSPARFAVELHDKCFGRGELRLSILANGVEFAERSCNLGLQGNLEFISAKACAGWLISPERPQRAFIIDVFRDGTLAGTSKCDIPREDVRAVFPDCVAPAFTVTLDKSSRSALEAANISVRLRGSDADLFDGPYVVGGRAAAVLAAQRAARLPYRGLEGIGAAESAVIQLALSEFLATARKGDGFTASRQVAFSRATAEPAPRLSIIIPVYRGVEVTRACIESVLAHRNAATDHVILINDASPDEPMAGMLQSFASVPNVFVLTNEVNVGFVQTVNRGLAFAAGSDVILLNSDTVLFAGGLDEICRIANSSDEIASVTALSSNATIFSYPHVELRAEALPDISWAQLAQIALEENGGLAIDIPTGHGFCLLLKDRVLRRIGFLDEGFGRGYGEENDLCMRAANLGYRHVLAAGALVQHRESISFIGEKDGLLAQNLPRLNAMYPEYTPVVMNFEAEDGIRRARWALDRARLRNAAEAGQEFILVISNALDGGTAKAIKDIENAAGYGAATKLSLRCLDNGNIELLCDSPSLWATFSPRETDDLFGVVAAARPPRVLVHQLLGFPAAFISRLGTWVNGLHGVYYIHDFYPICPRVTMIDAIGRFCDVADTDTCARCVKMGGSHETSKLDELTPAEHRALFADALVNFRHIVAPSPSAAGYVQRAFPSLTVQAIPHPERMDNGAATAREGSNDEIVLLGALGPHKGSTKLLEIAQRARLTHPKLRFRIIGHTDIDKQLNELGNVIITGKYKPEQLPGLIAQAKGRLTIFLSSWPETYSYTLSEAAKYGFIPMVADIGAPAERVRTTGYGVVFPFPVNAAQVLDIIEDVGAGRLPAFAEGATPSRLYPSREDIELGSQILQVQTPAATPRPSVAGRKTASKLRWPAAS